MTVPGALFVTVSAIVAIGLSGYYGYMAWQQPEKLRKSQLRHLDELQHHPLSGISRGWVESESWIWWVRIGSILMFLISTLGLLFVILSLFGWISLPIEG